VLLALLIGGSRRDCSSHEKRTSVLKKDGFTSKQQNAALSNTSDQPVKEYVTHIQNTISVGKSEKKHDMETSGTEIYLTKLRKILWRICSKQELWSQRYSRC
jgi:hypothetical protein